MLFSTSRKVGKNKKQISQPSPRGLLWQINQDSHLLKIENQPKYDSGNNTDEIKGLNHIFIHLQFKNMAGSAQVLQLCNVNVRNVIPKPQQK